MSDYQTALDIFNETVANLSRFADAQRAEVIYEINGIQAHSYDPSDTGAYNLTMYGIDQVSLLKNHVVDTVGNASNYFTPNNASAALQTDHTSISTSLLQAPAEAITRMFTHPVSNAAALDPVNVIGGIVVIAVFLAVLSQLLVVKR